MRSINSSGNTKPNRRIASHPDDPTAPLADRLMLALGMWPSYVEELGVEAVLDAVVALRTKAHQFEFVAEDYGDAAGKLMIAEGLLEEMHQKLKDWTVYRIIEDYI